MRVGSNPSHFVSVRRVCLRKYENFEAAIPQSDSPRLVSRRPMRNEVAKFLIMNRGLLIFQTPLGLPSFYLTDKYQMLRYWTLVDRLER